MTAEYWKSGVNYRVIVDTIEIATKPPVSQAKPRLPWRCSCELWVRTDGEAAINQQVCSSDPGSVGAGEVGDCSGHISRQTASAERMQLCYLPGKGFRIVRRTQPFVPHRGVDIAWANGVDADSSGRQFQCEIAGQRDQSGLGTGVGYGIGKGMAGVNGADVDDGAALVREQRRERLAEQHGGPQVDGQHLIEKRSGYLLEGQIKFDRGVVDEHVYSE